MPPEKNGKSMDFEFLSSHEDRIQKLEESIGDLEVKQQVMENGFQTLDNAVERMAYNIDLKLEDLSKQGTEQRDAIKDLQKIMAEKQKRMDSLSKFFWATLIGIGSIVGKEVVAIIFHKVSM